MKHPYFYERAIPKMARLERERNAWQALAILGALATFAMTFFIQ